MSEDPYLSKDPYPRVPPSPTYQIRLDAADGWGLRLTIALTPTQDQWLRGFLARHPLGPAIGLTILTEPGAATPTPTQPGLVYTVAPATSGSGPYSPGAGHQPPHG